MLRCGWLKFLIIQLEWITLTNQLMKDTIGFSMDFSHNPTEDIPNIKKFLLKAVSLFFVLIILTGIFVFRKKSDPTDYIFKIKGKDCKIYEKDLRMAAEGFTMNDKSAIGNKNRWSAADISLAWFDKDIEIKLIWEEKPLEYDSVMIEGLELGLEISWNKFRNTS